MRSSRYCRHYVVYGTVLSLCVILYTLYYMNLAWRMEPFGNEPSLGYGATAISCEGTAPLSFPAGLSGTRDTHGYMRWKWEMIERAPLPLARVLLFLLVLLGCL